MAPPSHVGPSTADEERARALAARARADEARERVEHDRFIQEQERIRKNLLANQRKATERRPQSAAARTKHVASAEE